MLLVPGVHGECHGLAEGAGDSLRGFESSNDEENEETMRFAVWKILALVMTTATVARADVAAEVRQLTGRPTRLVWAQAVDQPDDLCAQGDRFRLLGLDTEDGRGIRPIRSEISGYSKPLFTTDGLRVVYSNRRENAVYVVRWDGSGLRKLVSGFASDVWTDPKTGIEWVLVRTGNGDQNNAIVRYRIDKPEVHEDVWTKTANGHNLMPWFRLSADGTRAADAFPWSSCGVADVSQARWQQYAGGCWPSMAPDNSYRTFVFQGNHREVAMFDRDGTHQRTVAVNKAPGIDGRDVYFPRWASQPRFLTMTGPGVGGAQANLYLGRFDEGFNAVEKWVQITHDDKGDFFGDAWIEPSGPASSTVAAETPKPRDVDDSGAWPGSREGLVFLWENGSRMNAIVDPIKHEETSCRAIAHGLARHGFEYVMDLTGGSFAAENADARLLAACQATNQLSIEALITPAKASQVGPARIITFSSGTDTRNFTLGQEGDRLIFRLRTPETGPNGANPQVDLGKLTPGVAQHVIVTYAPGRLTCFRDGRQTLTTDEVRGDFRNWASQHLLFGDEWGGGRDWAGLLEGIAIQNRVLSAEEAHHRYELATRRLRDRRIARTTGVAGEAGRIVTDTASEPHLAVSSRFDRQHLPDRKGFAGKEADYRHDSRRRVGHPRPQGASKPQGERQELSALA